MIILLGPDNSGKSTLAQTLMLRSVGTDRRLSIWKATASTNYSDYLGFLRGPKSDVKDITTYRPGTATLLEGAVVCDRFFYCEIPYAHILRGNERIQWSLKQWHNLHLSTLSFNPVIVLSTRRNPRYIDSVPEEMFEPILAEYKKMLDYHHLEYLEYDYEQDEPLVYSFNEGIRNDRIAWWLKSPELYGVGNTVDPVVLIMAQDLGPSNAHRIPFEQGPSGYYLSDLLDGKNLGSFYLTNWIKTPDMGRNMELLRTELENLRPTHVILLGRQAEDAEPVLDEFVAHTNVHHLVHPGWAVNHGGTISEVNRRKAKLEEQWEEAWTKIANAM